MVTNVHNALQRDLAQHIWQNCRRLSLTIENLNYYNLLLKINCMVSCSISSMFLMNLCSFFAFLFVIIINIKIR